MIGDILTNQLPHMQPYIRFHLPSPQTSSTFTISYLFSKCFSCVCRFCSCQLNGATLIQQKTDDNPDIKDFLKVPDTQPCTPVVLKMLLEIKWFSDSF